MADHTLPAATMKKGDLVRIVTGPTTLTQRVVKIEPSTPEPGRMTVTFESGLVLPLSATHPVTFLKESDQ